MSVQQTSDGGYIVGGNARTVASFNRYDYWLMRLDTNGNVLWNRTYGGTNDENLRVVRQTIDGGFILGGESFSGVSGDKTTPGFGTNDFWLVRVDSAGSKLWDRTYGGSDSELLFALELMPDGGFIAVGASSSTNGNKSAPCFGGLDGWLVRCNSAGERTWEQSVGGNSLDGISSISKTVDGGFILGATTFSGVSGNKTAPLCGQADMWVIKTSPEPPQLRWERCCFEDLNPQWRLLLGGTSNLTYRVDASTNLVDWMPMQTNQLFGPESEVLRGSLQFRPQRFFRAALLP
jgi:hypothetical protein